MEKRADIQAIIPAAGKGRRIGTPKAFLSFGEHTFVEEIVANLRAAGFHRLGIVTSFEQYHRYPNYDLGEYQTIINFTPEKGQFSSIRLAVINIAEAIQGCLLMPVDHPAVAQETFRSLYTAWAENKKRTIVIPTYRHKRGHPLIIPSRIFPQICDAVPETTLRDIIHENDNIVTELKVNDPGILKNINTPEDYKKLRTQNKQKKSH